MRHPESSFQVVGVWESKEDFERHDKELIGPVVAELSGGQAPPAGQQGAEEFEVGGLLLPGARVFA